MGSEFEYCFDDAILPSTYLLSKQFSNQIWRRNIDDTLPYFDLSNVNIRTTVICNNWLHSYNNHHVNDVGNILSDIPRWENDDMIYFCISQFIIIESKWSEFIVHWRGFLCMDEDSPIILNPSILIFY